MRILSSTFVLASSLRSCNALGSSRMASTQALGQAFGRAVGQASGVEAGAATLRSGGGADVDVSLSQPDIDGNKFTKAKLHYAVDAAGVLSRASRVRSELPGDVVCEARSPSGKTAVFRTRDAGGALEIYEESVLVQRLPLDENAVGKLLCGDAMVGGVSWNADESLVAFVADGAVAPKAEAFAGAFAYREELGEKYVGVSRPSVFVADLQADDGALAALAPPPGYACEGQPTFHPSKPRELLTVAWKEYSAKLGLVYCFNRPSSIFARSGGAWAAEAQTSEPLARSPRWRPDGSTFCYLGGDFQTHDGPVALRIRGEKDDVVPVAAGGADLHVFPGIWGAATLPRDCWVDDATLVVNSLWRSAPCCLKVDAKTGKISPLGDDVLKRSHKLLCVAGAYAVIATSAPDDAAGALLAVDAQTGAVASRLPLPPMGVVHGKAAFDSAPASLRCAARRFPENFEANLLWDESTPEPRPLVVYVHGGPHSCTPLAYGAPQAFLASRGYAVLSPNYRGSTGFGADALNALPGRVGDLDVRDVVAATEAELEKNPSLDRGAVAVVGGSHGGFLGAWLMAKRPDLYTCACLRNPVTNIAAMVGVTDIPDWCAVEVGVEVEAPATPATLAKLFAASPASKIDDVAGSILLAVGMRDRRVPPSQAVDYYRALKKKGKDVEMLVYPDDDHALDTPRTTADFFAECARFLDNRLNGDETWKIAAAVSSAASSGDRVEQVVAREKVAAGAVVVSVTRSPRSLRSEPAWDTLQVGEAEHVRFSAKALKLNHSATPNCRVRVGAESIDVVAVADLAAGDALSFDYRTTEWALAEPFVDWATGETVGGFSKAAPEVQAALLEGDLVAPHIRRMAEEPPTPPRT